MLLNGTHLSLQDDQEIRVGAGDDLKIYHDGSKSFITNSGSTALEIEALAGDLILRGTDNVYLQSGTTDETFFKGTVNGAAELYYDNSKKFETKSDGVDITGEVQCDTLDVDGSADISSSLNVSGNATFHGNVDLHDNDLLRIGTGDDLQIYHNGTNSFIENGTGELLLRAKTGENSINCNPDGSVELFYNNSKKFETKSDGIDVTGEVQCDTLDVDGNADISGILNLGNNLDMPDNQKIILGTGDDLQIYHNGSHSYIDDTGTGNLYIRAADALQLQKYTGENFVKCVADGTVQLYYDDSKKLETTSDGVKITGGLQDADGDLGTSGQVLSSTGTALNWVDADSGPQGVSGS